MQQVIFIYFVENMNDNEPISLYVRAICTINCLDFTNTR